MEFRTLKPTEIDCRVGQVTAKGYTLLLYKDARCDMNILDESVGSENWQRDHKEVKGNLYCGVSIKFGVEGGFYWATKWDCGVESNTEKEKGEASDSFKRACVNWGIGRELYSAPFIFIPCKTTPRDGGRGYDLPMEEKYRHIIVDEIEYNAEREISKLVLVDEQTGGVVFKFGEKKGKVEPKKITDAQLDTIKELNVNIENVLKVYGVKSLEDLTCEQAEHVIEVKKKQINKG